MVRAPEHRATWARLEIRVGNEWATLVEDRDSGSARRSLYCPLYPFAEWVAYNWWFLQADSRPAKTLGRLTELGTGDLRNLPRIQHDRHSVRASGDGFAWPDLWIVPEGDQRTRLIWRPDATGLSTWPVKFISRGDRFSGSDGVVAELGRLVSEVLTRLKEQGISGTALEKEWAGIIQTDSEEAEFCRTAARLGLDPYAMEDEYESVILRAADELPNEVFGDLVDAADPALLNDSLDWVIRVSSEIQSLTTLSEVRPDLLGIRDEVRVQGSSGIRPPWQVGWEQARLLRNAMQVSSSDKFEIKDYVSTLDAMSPDAELVALGRVNEGGIPVAALGRRTGPTGQRFALARSYWHFIWEDGAYFLVTGAYTDRLKTERAFAAELLAPAEGIADRLGGDPRDATEEDLDEVAAHFGVQPMLIGHQVRNQIMPRRS
jgi:Zn-dependent peptidase ImmA (M78 family)